MLPLSAMVVCAAIFTKSAPICEAADRNLYLCVKERCAPVRSLSVEWRRALYGSPRH